MATSTSIQWTDQTWNPIVGCTKVSPGCAHCYAEVMAKRLRAMALADIQAGRDPGRKRAYIDAVDDKGRWTGKLVPVPEALADPLAWKKPRMVFVNSMSDLFHGSVSDSFIDSVFRVMFEAKQHTFQVLTKRADRMAKYCGNRWGEFDGKEWQPAPNVWLGCSVEDQQRADERIPFLLQTPAAVRFLSCEPLLGNADLFGVCEDGLKYDVLRGISKLGPLKGRISWVIVGGESGLKARPCRVDWVRSLVRQCLTAEVPCFVKQLGSNVIDRNDNFGGWEPHQWPEDTEYQEDLCGFRDGYQGAPVRIRLRDCKGGDPSEWPEDLRVREFPRA